MPLVLGSCAQYLTEHVPNMRSSDYNATHLVKATKGLPLHPNSYSDVVIQGQPVRIAEGNKDRAMDWFAEWATRKLAALPAGPKVIVPIPSSKSTPRSAATFRTALIAQRIASLSPNTQTVPSLRFKIERPNTREEGGSRDAHVLYEEMILIQQLPPGEVIILDDVVTSGGHLKASAWLIEDQRRVVQHAIACGRSSDTQFDDPFAIPPENIDLSRSPFVF